MFLFRARDFWPRSAKLGGTSYKKELDFPFLEELHSLLSLFWNRIERDIHSELPMKSCSEKVGIRREFRFPLWVKGTGAGLCLAQLLLWKGSGNLSVGTLSAHYCTLMFVRGIKNTWMQQNTSRVLCRLRSSRCLTCAESKSSALLHSGALRDGEYRGGQSGASGCDFRRTHEGECREFVFQWSSQANKGIWGQVGM